MSKHDHLLFTNPTEANIFTALTIEAWLNPRVVAELGDDRLSAVRSFARRNGYAVPTDLEIAKFELPANPAGDLEFQVAVPTMTATVDEYGCGTTAETGCNSNNGTCPSPTRDCISTSPSSCPTMDCLSIAMCSNDCPTYQCTVSCLG